MMRFVSTYLLVAMLIISPAFAADGQTKGSDPFPLNRGTIYEFDQNNPPEICFFPQDKARWNGYEVMVSHWKQLTDYQKEMFFREAAKEILVNENAESIELADKWRMLLAMNPGTAMVEKEMPDIAPKMPMIKFVFDTLKEGGNIKYKVAGTAPEVSCEDMMARLKAGEKISSGKWWDCLDEGKKQQVIGGMIKLLKEKDGIVIKSPAAYYVREIDAFRSDEPRLREASIKQLLTNAAVMSYDFDEGIPKEETLKKYAIPEHAAEIIKLREEEGTPEGRLPTKILTGANQTALLMATVEKAGGFTND